MNSKWFRRFGAAEPEGGLSLVCFPHAGASATAYLRLARSLPAGLDVMAVQYPGRQDRHREEPCTSIGHLAESVAAELSALGSRPYAFFGHSMGAVVAYETARLLQSGELPSPVRMFLSGRGAPGPRPSVHDRLFDDADVLAAVRRLGGTDQAVLDDPELLEMVLPVLRADYRALGTYSWRSGPPLQSPVTTLIGDHDPVVTIEEASGWRDHTTGDFALEVFSGGHFYLDDRLPEVTEVITAGLLQEARAS